MIVGIDPGKGGGLAYIGTEIVGAGAMPMPLVGKDIDGHELAMVLHNWKPDMVIVERVHAMPGQGVTSMFTFGMGYGRLLGILEALGIPYRLVTPQAWKKTVLAGTTKDKSAAVQFCRRAFPGVSLTPGRKRVPHDGMADALCLAEYGRQLMAKGAA